MHLTFRPQHKRGFTLIESLVGTAVFVLIAVSVYQAYTTLFEIVRVSRLKVTAAALSNEQFEIMRNLPFAEVGVVAGIPAGKIPPTQTLTRDGITFTAKTTIRNVDDPFDGTLGGVPNDLSPADYKFAEVEIMCPSCKNFQPLIFSTSVAPKNLEGASTNGVLFIRVFDANGQPIPGANVHIENNAAAPAIAIDDTTNADGLLQIVDAPPGIEAYEITVSKTGYSQSKTYPTGAVGNPNPVTPHATVAIQQVTQMSFSIDKTSTVNVASITETCTPISSVDFLLQGSKIIGTGPDILSYSSNQTTSVAGQKNITGLTWDTYTASLTDAAYDLIGSIPLSPFTLNPNATQELKLLVASKKPNRLLVTVKDSSTQLPLSDSSVKLEKAGYDKTLITGNGFLTQTDWSGGSGQDAFVDPAKHFASDGNLDIANPTGELRLKQVFAAYETSGVITSSTLDTGSVSNFHQVVWQPQDQPIPSGTNSVKFQIATNNDQTTWNFLGPDGTSNTYYTLANPIINATHNGDRYIRYKMFMKTDDQTFTPNISDVSITFTSSCVAPGQVSFASLAAGGYTMTVSRTGYQTSVSTVTITSAGWQQQEVVLTP